MQAILVKDDAARSFYLAEAPTPKPAPDAVLIEIYATAVNRADLLQRRELYPPPVGESDIIGSVLRSRSLSEKVAITAAFKEKALPLFINQQIHPVIDSVFSLAEADKAHAHVAANKNFGKVVLRVRYP